MRGGLIAAVLVGVLLSACTGGAAGSSGSTSSSGSAGSSGGTSRTGSSSTGSSGSGACCAQVPVDGGLGCYCSNAAAVDPTCSTCGPLCVGAGCDGGDPSYSHTGDATSGVECGDPANTCAADEYCFYTNRCVGSPETLCTFSWQCIPAPCDGGVGPECFAPLCVPTDPLLQHYGILIESNGIVDCYQGGT